MMDSYPSRALASGPVRLRHWGRAVSLQFSILKVLAGQPKGRATVAELNRYITLLSCSEWTARMKRLSARVPELDIFSSRYVMREDFGWQLTEAGRDFLLAVEMPVPAIQHQEIAQPEVIVMVQAPARQSTAPPLRLVIHNPLRGRSRGNRDNRSVA
jgi:hypothetical protein